MTEFQQTMLTIVNSNYSNATANLYYLLFNHWPRFDCLPEFRKSLWQIVLSIDQGDELYEFLDFSSPEFEVRIGPVGEQKGNVVFYTEAEMTNLEHIVSVLHDRYRDVIVMLYRQNLEYLPDDVLATFTSKLLKIITDQQETILHMQDNLHTLAQSGKEYDPDNPLTWDIENFNFSLRSYNCLKRAGINTAIDLTKLTISKFKKIRNFGEKSQEEVLAILKSHNIQLIPD